MFGESMLEKEKAGKQFSLALCVCSSCAVVSGQGADVPGAVRAQCRC